MTSFWLADRNRADVEGRLPRGVAELLKRLEPERQQLLGHPLYDAISTVEDLCTFMRFHVFAVWDFMCILKELQRRLTCVDVPWRPVGDPRVRRLVNEIVVSEETDDDDAGSYAAHFELYLDAMDQVGAASSEVRRLLEQLEDEEGLESALKNSAAPVAAQQFSLETFEVITGCSTAAIAAAFTFSREDVVPVMFKAIVERLRQTELTRLDRFIYYLDRHIAVDSDFHGPMAFEMINLLCGDEPALWDEAEDAGRRTILSRCRLWDAAVAAMGGALDQPGDQRNVVAPVG